MEKSYRHSLGALNDDEEIKLELKFQNESFFIGLESEF